MTKLDELLLNDIEKYTLNNKDLPITMQKFPWISEISANALRKNINLTMIEEPSDYVYFILGSLGKSAIIDLNDIQYGYYFDMLKFFKLLEDYLVLFFEIKKVESAIFMRKRKNRKISLLQEKILNDIIKKFDIKENIFDLMNIQTWNSDIKMKEASSLFTYTNLLKNEYKNKE